MVLKAFKIRYDRLDRLFKNAITLFLWAMQLENEGHSTTEEIVKHQKARKVSFKNGSM